MRREETVDIQMDDRTTRSFTVYEVRPRDILAAVMDNDKGLDASFVEMMGADVLPLLTTATMDDLKAMYPSDIETLMEALRRVNAPLLKGFQAMERIDLGPTVEMIKASIVNDLLAFAAGLLRRGTPGASTMAGDGSSPPPTSSTATIADA